jgi:voltage-gated potassium channel
LNLQKLKRIVEHNDTRWGRVLDFFILSLVVVSLVTFSIETLPNLPPAAHHWLYVTEVITVAIFTVEYLLRLLVADRKLGFVVSFFGLVDLLAILPFYLTVGLDLRSIRVLRFLRVFRALKMARYSKAVQRFHRAFLIAKEEIVLFFIVAMMVIYFAAVGIYYFENEAQPHGWWQDIYILCSDSRFRNCRNSGRFDGIGVVKGAGTRR